MQHARAAPEEPGFRYDPGSTPTELLGEKEMSRLTTSFIFLHSALSLAKTYDQWLDTFGPRRWRLEGFTSFVGRGKMRLITGADFDPEDVKAILAGDQEVCAR